MIFSIYCFRHFLTDINLITELRLLYPFVEDCPILRRLVLNVFLPRDSEPTDRNDTNNKNN